MTVVGVFFAVVAIGLVYALFHLEPSVSPSAQVTAPAPSALTIDAYHQEAKSILAPFLEQAVNVAPENLADEGQTLKDLIGKTKDRLLRLSKLPKEARETHVAFVLLLDKWNRALSGSVSDQRTVVESTRQLVAANPWLR